LRIAIAVIDDKIAEAHKKLTFLDTAHWHRPSGYIINTHVWLATLSLNDGYPALQGMDESLTAGEIHS